MSAIAVLTLNNNAAVAHAFNPAGLKEGIMRWNTVTQAVYDARRSVTQSLVDPKSASPVYRARQRILLPHMDAVNTSQKNGESYVNIELVFSRLATTTDRLDLRSYAGQLVANAVTTALVTDLENPY